MKLQSHARNVAAVLAMTYAVSAPADDLPSEAVCALQQAVACSAYAPCERTLPGAVNLPALLRVDTTRKTVESRLDDGTVRTSTVQSVAAGAGRLVLQGYDDGHPWAMHVDTESGAMTLSVLRADDAFTAFGVCSASILE